MGTGTMACGGLILVGVYIVDRVGGGGGGAHKAKPLSP